MASISYPNYLTGLENFVIFPGNNFLSRKNSAWGRPAHVSICCFIYFIFASIMEPALLKPGSMHKNVCVEQ